ncbi:MAG TPA: ExeM/NucH family extracellular endonuclease [Aliidiomarina sp.]|nr:ExeM/NucH family extracellular endonuclease [Aliidiomarina sp.]
MFIFRRVFVSFSVLLFVIACTPTPVEQVSIPIAERCGDESVAIDRIARYLADTVIVEGVVSASFQGQDQLRGFFIHALNKNAANQPSNAPRPALFVRDNSFGPRVQMGDRVRIEGEKSEYGGALALNNITALTRCAANQPVVTESLTLPIEYVAQLDNLLHQRVRVAQPMTVTGHYQLARYGTLDLATERLWVPTQITMPGPSARDHSSYNFLRSIVLDDGSELENPDPVPYPPPALHINNPVRSGDTVHDIEGVLVKVGDAYHIHPVQTPRFEATNPRPVAVSYTGTETGKGDLTIAAFNVLNYFNGDAASGGFPTARGAISANEFERQRARIISAMTAINADVFALMEMANNGFDNNSAIADLTRGLQATAPAGARYEYVRAAANKVGDDVITQAIIYRADKVQEVGQAVFTELAPFNSGSRPPLAQSFRSLSTGGEFTVVANHFKSKGSCPEDMNNPNRNRNDGQGCWNQLRTESATALARWLRTFPTGREHRNYIVLGDFNSYAMEDPLMELRRNGYRNIANRLAPEGYSYVFRGEMGSLDHILAHSDIADAVTGIDFWHINADEPVAFEYGTRHKTAQQQRDWYEPTPYRSSDHDPVIIKVDSTQFISKNDKTD